MILFHCLETITENVNGQCQWVMSMDNVIEHSYQQILQFKTPLFRPTPVFPIRIISNFSFFCWKSIMCIGQATEYKADISQYRYHCSSYIHFDAMIMDIHITFIYH